MCTQCNWVKFGFDRKGNQRFICKTCHKTRVSNPNSNRISEEIKEKIFKAHKEKISQRAIARIFGISLTSVSRILEKK